MTRRPLGGNGALVSNAQAAHLARNVVPYETVLLRAHVMALRAMSSSAAAVQEQHHARDTVPGMRCLPGCQLI